MVIKFYFSKIIMYFTKPSFFTFIKLDEVLAPSKSLIGGYTT